MPSWHNPVSIGLGGGPGGSHDDKYVLALHIAGSAAIYVVGTNTKIKREAEALASVWARTIDLSNLHDHICQEASRAICLARLQRRRERAKRRKR